MFNNPYAQRGINQQNMYEQIDSQINQLQQMKEQMKNNQQQPANLTQNFQISPINRETIKYASSIDEIQKENVVGDTPFFSRDMSVVWIKNAKGEIKSYELNEIVPKDEKDILISSLQMQIEELRKEVEKNASNVTNDGTKQDETNTTANDESVRTTVKENKSTSVQKISRSKTK